MQVITPDWQNFIQKVTLLYNKKNEKQLLFSCGCFLMELSDFRQLEQHPKWNPPKKSLHELGWVSLMIVLKRSDQKRSDYHFHYPVLFVQLISYEDNISRGNPKYMSAWSTPYEQIWSQSCQLPRKNFESQLFWIEEPTSLITFETILGKKFQSIRLL